MVTICGSAGAISPRADSGIHGGSSKGNNNKKQFVVGFLGDRRLGKDVAKLEGVGGACGRQGESSLKVLALNLWCNL